MKNIYYLYERVGADHKAKTAQSMIFTGFLKIFIYG